MQRLHVVRDLAVEELLGAGAAQGQLAPLGAVEQPAPRGQDLVVGGHAVGDGHRFRIASGRALKIRFSLAKISVMAVRGIATSSAIEDYAKAIYGLELRAGGAVSTNALAERLGVTAASASGMVKRLDELSLGSHVPYRGVELTADGRRLALEVLRHHRLLELYLAEDGIGPGSRFQIVDKHPFVGPLFARFGAEVHVLGGTLAQAMRVEVKS